MTFVKTAARIAGTLGALAAATGGVNAQSRAITSPNLTRADGPVSVDFAGSTFVNQGLQGVGRRQ